MLFCLFMRLFRCPFLILYQRFNVYNCFLDAIFDRIGKCYGSTRRCHCFSFIFEKCSCSSFSFNHFPFIIIFRLCALVSSVWHETVLFTLVLLVHIFRIIIGTQCRRVGNIIHFFIYSLLLCRSFAIDNWIKLNYV